MDDVPKPFFEHLEELRVRLIRSLIAVGIGTAAGYYEVDNIIDYLARPVGQFIYLHPTEAFFVRLKIAITVGVLLAIPVILYQIWQFIMIALTPNEKRSIGWVLPISYILFLMGAAFGFFILVPAGVKFLLSYNTKALVAQISIDYYFDFMGMLCLILGGIFQMPLVAFFLAKIGILHWSMLSGQRRVAVLVIYIASAVLTPGPDPVTAIMLAVPTYLLFECSILAAKWAENRYRQ